MHDPMIVIYRCRLFTLWHIDPETDGSDDSCGWCRPRLTKHQRSMIDWIAGCEAREPWFQRYRAKEPRHAADAETLLRGAIISVGQTLRIPVTVEEATKWAIRLLHNPGDHIRGSLALLPGWHTNSEEDTEYWRKEHAEQLFYCVARFILRSRRHWWQHPRWHVRHWKLQIHALQTFKRWAWSRCTHCGKPFTWGYAPISHGWDSDGPQWFKGETGVYHHECSGQSSCLVKIEEGANP